jgi:hypothetical protein
MKIFWSWQSDTDGKTGRFFVRDALADAIMQLKQPEDVEEPHERDLREAIHLDQDRQGVSGTPPIAKVIFDKIDKTDVFVADVTPVASLKRLKPTDGEPPEKKVINPNVAIEYGYAVRKVGDELILLVQNTHYGNRSDLPFDLQHKGSPIQYHLAPNASPAERVAEKKKLTGLFVSHLRACMATVTRSSALQARFDELSPRDGNRAFFWQPSEILARYGTRHPFGLREAEDDVYEYRFESHQALYVRLIPGTPHSKSFTFDALMDIVEQKRTVRVMTTALMDGMPCKNAYGAIYYQCSGDNLTPVAFTQLHRNGEIWSVTRECWQSLRDMEVVPMVAMERALRHGLQNFLHVMQQSLGIDPPYEVEIGMRGLKGCCLARPLGRDRIQVYGNNYSDPIQSDPSPVRRVINDPGPEAQTGVVEEFVRSVYALAGLDPPAPM